MTVRPPVFSEQGWYPNSREECSARVAEYQEDFAGKPTGALAGIVPHAGWVFSGRLASWTFAALAQAQPDVVFVFGGHMGPGQTPVCMAEGEWGTPLGPVPVHRELASELVEQFAMHAETPERFAPDNTIELQMPILKHTWPQAQVVAVQTPPSQVAIQIGRQCAQSAQKRGLKALAIGSTDLTHYGPNYGFSPKGSGPEAHTWSKEQNDRPFIERLLELDHQGAQEHALANHSACCPGAATATLEFARARGAQAGQLIAHQTSHEVEPRGRPTMWVGYAAIVF